jgi:hypothetical protein
MHSVKYYWQLDVSRIQVVPAPLFWSLNCVEWGMICFLRLASFKVMTRISQFWKEDWLMHALHAFSASCWKGKNQDFTRLVLRKSIAAPFEGLKFVCHIESECYGLQVCMKYLSVFMRSWYVMNYAMNVCTMVVTGILKAREYWNDAINLTVY